MPKTWSIALFNARHPQRIIAVEECLAVHGIAWPHSHDDQRTDIALRARVSNMHLESRPRGPHRIDVAQGILTARVRLVRLFSREAIANNASRSHTLSRRRHSPSPVFFRP